ncbi:hypothetical protein L1987_18875 [Smallanthus sonchifolius]|uniref:Uncharacterized protein n=1 Tax=Smallanthus sonchifolius TaxID=185202 RepID=A0ACB9J350_9ASTR|nr:hypothetical protein L1987_18875 [Smallanthus sonchifolius]
MYTTRLHVFVPPCNPTRPRSPNLSTPPSCNIGCHHEFHRHLVHHPSIPRLTTTQVGHAPPWRHPADSTLPPCTTIPVTFARPIENIVLVVAMNGGNGDSSNSENGHWRHDKKLMNSSVIEVVDDDHVNILRRLRESIDRVAIETPKIEVRYENLLVEGDAYIGDRALPTLYNATINSIENTLGFIGLTPSKKRKIKILQSISGIIKPSRMTLLLGPPGAGKTTFLLALAAKLAHDLKVSGNVTYCGYKLSEFIPQRTCAYISPNNLHTGEMTVRETLDFSGRCLGVGPRYKLLTDILKMEKEVGTKPDLDTNTFMDASKETNLITDYVLKFSVPI